jgi:hypothetical protein
MVDAGTLNGAEEIELNKSLLTRKTTARKVRSLDVVDAKERGLLGDDATNDSPAFTALIAGATEGSTVYFPPGTYRLGATVVVNKTLHFVGHNATIDLPIDDVGLNITASDVSFTGLKFSGTGKNGGHTSQYAIQFSQAALFRVINCEFTTMGGAGITYTETSTFGDLGGSIVGCLFYDNNYGIDAKSNGEYAMISACTIINNNTGIRLAGGNNIVSGCNMAYNDIGFEVKDGANDGHGILTGCNINHNNDYAVKIHDTANGYTITSCHIYEGDIWLKNCNGIAFEACLIDIENYYFEASTAVVFRNIRFDSNYAVAVNNNFNATVSETSWIDCCHIDGRRATNAITFLTGNISADKFVASGDAYYFGDSSTDGSWRIIRSGNNLVRQRREAGVWTTKGTDTP